VFLLTLKGPIESIYALITREQEKSNKQMISLNV